MQNYYNQTGVLTSRAEPIIDPKKKKKVLKIFLTWRGCFWGAPRLVLPGRLSSVWWGRIRRLTSVPAPAASSGAGGPAADSLLLRWTCHGPTKTAGHRIAPPPRLPSIITRQDVSPVLQLVHAGIGRTADAGDLLPLLPLWQFLRDEVRQ